MSVAKLNVEIGAQIKGLQDGLRQSERELKRFSANMASLGNQLSAAFTLPILGIGAAAVKAAGDMEALRLAMRATFEGAGRSIEAADKELEALRQSARAPGLDFEQAVKGSVRLQNVGFTAEKARMTIEQLANTITTTGGTAEDLNEVVNQFSQMIGKGKIFQDDLKIITGRMPKLAQLMKETWGTTTAEGLNKLGIDARTFIDTVTTKMGQLPRVSGGISNAIVNAWSSVRQSLATLGDTLNKTFNVTGRLDQFSAWVESLTTAFANLSDGTRTAILGVAVFAATIGPAIRVVGLLGSGVMALANAWKALQIAMIKIDYKGVIGWWKTLNATMRANIIGVTVAAALALAAAFSLLAKDTSAAAQAQRQMQSVNEKAAQSIVEEKKQVDDLVHTIRAYNTTAADRERALKKLQDIAPEYFGSLKVEKSLVVGLAEAQARYNNAILLSATAKVAAEEYAATQKKLLDTTGRLGDAQATWQQSLKNAAISMVGLGPLFGNLLRNNLDASDATENFGRQTADLILQRERYGDIERKALDSLRAMGVGTEEVTDKTKTLNDATAESGKKAKDAEIAYDGAARRVGQMADAMLRLKEVQAAFSLAKPLQALPSGGGLGSTESGTALAPVESLTAANEQLARTQQILAGLQNTASAATKPISTMAEAVHAAGQAMYDAAATGESSFKALAGSAVASAAKVVRAWIQQGVAAAVAKALSGIPFPFNIAAGLAAGGLAAGLFNKLLSGLKVPGFAQGTRFAPGGLSLVGERGPELLNLPRGSQVIPNHNLRGMMGGGPQEVRVTGIIRGNDIYLINEREGQRRGRTKG